MLEQQALQKKAAKINVIATKQFYSYGLLSAEIFVVSPNKYGRG
jgi:hypothetical protein